MATNLSLADQVANAVTLHENTSPDVLTLAASGLSGYSVGLTQYDFHAHEGSTQGTQNLNDFISLLNETTSQTGLTTSQIATIQNAIQTLGGSSSITPGMVAMINQALATPGGVLFTNDLDGQDLATDVQGVQQLITAADTNKNGGGVLAAGNMNPQAVAELAAFVNQFGSSNPILSSFLSTGAGTLPGGKPVVSNGTLSLSDLNSNYFSQLAYFSIRPTDYTDFLSASQQAATAANNNQIFWDGTFSSPVQQVAANGTITTTDSTSSGSPIYTDTTQVSQSGGAQAETTTTSLAGGDSLVTAVSISPSGTETTTESVDGFVAQVTVVSSQGYVTQTEFAGAAASSEDFYNGSVGSTVDAGSSTPASSTLGQADSDGSFTTTENGVTVSLGAGATVWANGTDQVVTAGAGSTVNDGFEGTNGNDGSLTVNGSGVAINVVEAYEAITTGGSGDKIGDTAYGAVLSTSGTAVTLGSLGSQQQVVTVTGNSNTIGGATNAQTWVYGTGNIVSLGSESALEVASGSTTLSAGSGSVGLFDGATVNLATPGNTVQQEQPGGVVDVTATGADGAANVVNGNGIQIDSYTGSLDLSGTGFSGTVSGSGLTLTSNSTASFSGSYV